MGNHAEVPSRVEKKRSSKKSPVVIVVDQKETPTDTPAISEEERRANTEKDNKERMIRQIKEFGMYAKGKQEALKFLQGHHVSLRGRVYAQCYLCQGMYASGKEDCRCTLCPFHACMPYKGSTGEGYVAAQAVSTRTSIEDLTEAIQNFKKFIIKQLSLSGRVKRIDAYKVYPEASPSAWINAKKDLETSGIIETVPGEKSKKDTYVRFTEKGRKKYLTNIDAAKPIKRTATKEPPVEKSSKKQRRTDLVEEPPTKKKAKSNDTPRRKDLVQEETGRRKGLRPRE